MTGIPIRGKAKGSAGAAYTIAVRRGAQRLDFLRDYLIELYKVSATLGIDADVLVAQADLETGAFTSTYWTRDGNPAGIAAFDDGSNWGLTFTPQTAADSQAAHMGRYLDIAVPTPLQKLDARWQAVADAGYVGTVTTTADLGNGKWATDPDYASKLIERYEAYWGPYVLAGDKPVATVTQKITHGNVPMFGYVDRQFVTANKPEGTGWDNLGPRDILAFVLHRMLGNLKGTDGFFADPSVGALTDFGMGVAAQDGKALAGIIYQWNDPHGYRSGWASGRVSAPYGDGLAFVNKYGVNAVNRRCVSMEVSGFEDTAIDDFSWGELVHFIAYYADQAKIPYTSFPINPATGISFIIWHQEFTIGTGKRCPFNVLMSRTNELINDVKAFLKKYQTVAVEVPPVVTIPPIEIPAPVYAEPKPIKGLALLSDADFKGQKAYTDAEGTRFRIVLDTVRVVDPKNFYRQRLSKNAPIIRADPKKNDKVKVIWSFLAADGKTEGYIDEHWARIFADQVVLEED